jgi:phosphopantothenoylcysteine decarboxylase/phosphopantothenate--cysteine ligase
MSAFFTARGHAVTLLLGEQATYRGELRAEAVRRFSTTTDLEQQLRALTNRPVGAIFHAAAVSDFKFGKIWLRSDNGELHEAKAGKVSTRAGTLLAELVPTSKIIARLRDWFPTALLAGWKYEVDGDRARVIELARSQISDSRTDACVANGPAYGSGFGLVKRSGEVEHLETKPTLFEALMAMSKSPGDAVGPGQT